MEETLGRRWVLRAADSAPTAAVGSELDFENLYLAAWPRLYRYAWLLVRHNEEAEDVASEAIRRAYAAWQSGRGPAGDPIPWLLLIARRIVIDRSRRRIPSWLPLSRTHDPAAPGNSFARVEAELWFEQLRECLSPRQHEAIVLRFLFDLPDDQIGRIMGLSPAGVRTNVSRGVAALRKRPEVLER